MRTQFEILLWMFCLNLAIGLVVGLGLAGTSYMAPITSTNSTDVGDEYEGHFNGTEVATNWRPGPLSGIPIIGDIFGGFNFFWQMLGYLVDGLPSLIMIIGQTWLGDSNGAAFDPVNSAGDAFSVIANVIRGVEALLVTVFLIEFISGRIFSD